MTSLAWFINGDPAPISYLRGRGARRRFMTPIYPGSPYKSPEEDHSSEEETPSRLHSSYDDVDGVSNVKALAIKFLVNPKHFIGGAMKMKCVASSIPEAFSRTHEEVILAEPSRGASFPGRYSSGEFSQQTSLRIPCCLR